MSSRASIFDLTVSTARHHDLAPCSAAGRRETSESVVPETKSLQSQVTHIGIHAERLARPENQIPERVVQRLNKPEREKHNPHSLARHGKKICARFLRQKWSQRAETVHRRN